jgi:hypothetical protein
MEISEDDAELEIPVFPSGPADFVPGSQESEPELEEMVEPELEEMVEQAEPPKKRETRKRPAPQEVETNKRPCTRASKKASEAPARVLRPRK